LLGTSLAIYVCLKFLRISTVRVQRRAVVSNLVGGAERSRKKIGQIKNTTLLIIGGIISVIIIIIIIIRMTQRQKVK
jgi:hypothetical protein